MRCRRCDGPNRHLRYNCRSRACFVHRTGAVVLRVLHKHIRYIRANLCRLVRIRAARDPAAIGDHRPVLLDIEEVLLGSDAALRRYRPADAAVHDRLRCRRCDGPNRHLRYNRRIHPKLCRHACVHAIATYDANVFVVCSRTKIGFGLYVERCRRTRRKGGGTQVAQHVAGRRGLVERNALVASVAIGYGLGGWLDVARVQRAERKSDRVRDNCANRNRVDCDSVLFECARVYTITTTNRKRIGSGLCRRAAEESVAGEG